MPKRNDEISFKIGVKRPSYDEQLKAIGKDVSVNYFIDLIFKPLPVEFDPLDSFNPLPHPSHEDDWLAQY